MVVRNCAERRICGAFEPATIGLFMPSMMAPEKSPSFVFAIDGKSTTNLNLYSVSKSWLWSGALLQSRAFDLDGRQTSYPYTATGMVILLAKIAGLCSACLRSVGFS